MSYPSAKLAIEQLVERFARLSARNRKGYNEPATRQEFILPLFRALGWNIEDTREVSPEEKVSRGYVDFSFRLHGIPRFFLETKKIPGNLEDPRWARQAINYAWLKGVTWAVLTDLEGLYQVPGGYGDYDLNAIDADVMGTMWWRAFESRMTRKERKTRRGSFALFVPFRGFRVSEPPPTNKSGTTARFHNTRSKEPL